MQHYTLAADIGATNTKIALYVQNVQNFELVELIELKTAEIKNEETFAGIIKKRIKTNFKELLAVCIACAGYVNEKRDHVQLTNSDIFINTGSLSKIFSQKDIICKKIFLLNDFEALGYSLNKFVNSTEDLSEDRNSSETSLITIKKGKPVKYKTIVLLGAGTGLGKSILVYNQQSKVYQPLQSEGGHIDFPVHDNFELQLAEFIKKQTHHTSLYFEDLLSGKGIINLYRFLYLKYRNSLKKEQLIIKKRVDTAEDKAAVISEYRKNDFLCKETFKLFTKYYAICLRNFALETMSVSGAFITGGIAEKNRDIFDNIFIQEFEKHDVHNQLLKDIPIYLLTDKTAGLYGCVYYTVFLSSQAHSRNT